MAAEDSQTFRVIRCRPSLILEQPEGLENLTTVANKLTSMKTLGQCEAISENKQVWAPVPSQSSYRRRSGPDNEHGFITAVRLAYNHHVPLALSPDHFWNFILQGVSNHIELNAETLRSKFVNFDGKQTLRINRPGFTKGSSENNWAGCFEEWAEQVEGFIGTENRENLCPEFTTTGPIETACMNAGLMDCMKSYFEYSCMTCCGIKSVKLVGTEQDWREFQEKVKGLREYDLDWWIDVLEPIVQNIVLSYTNPGEVNELFWETIYKHYSGAGSGTVPSVDGWITNFFPYTKSGRRNNFVSLDTLYARSSQKNQRRSFCQAPGMDYDAVPASISKTPFVWEYFGTDIPMEILSGFIGAEVERGSNNEPEFIKPVQFWAISEPGSEVSRQQGLEDAKNRTNRW